MKDSSYEELECIFHEFPKYRMRVLLGDFNAKIGKEEIFKPTIGNENLHKISNGNGVRAVNLVIPKSLTVKSTIFPHCNIHKFTCTSPNGKTHNQIDHILIDRKQHSSVLDL
jgi:endonuclease/exonuclease/phosphatase family metal-dependent hydrolase